MSQNLDSKMISATGNHHLQLPAPEKEDLHNEIKHPPHQVDEDWIKSTLASVLIAGIPSRSSDEYGAFADSAAKAIAAAYITTIQYLSKNCLPFQALPGPEKSSDELR